MEWLDYVLSHPNPPLVISTSYGENEQTGPPIVLHFLIVELIRMLQHSTRELCKPCLCRFCPTRYVIKIIVSTFVSVFKVPGVSRFCLLLEIEVSVTATQTPRARGASQMMAGIQHASCPVFQHRMCKLLDTFPPILISYTIRCP